MTEKLNGKCVSFPPKMDPSLHAADKYNRSCTTNAAYDDSFRHYVSVQHFSLTKECLPHESGMDTSGPDGSCLGSFHKGDLTSRRADVTAKKG